MRLIFCTNNDKIALFSTKREQLMFYGRKKELEILNVFLEKKTASLIVLKGRRRVGKSTLIKEFAKGMTFLSFAGVPPTKQTTRKSQIEIFGRTLNKSCGLPNVQYSDWQDAFEMLAAQTKSGRFIILLDEISWMGSKDPDFLGKFKNVWDAKLKQNPEIIVVLCGSISSWIEKNILSSTGFLGRISYIMTLNELPIEDCKSFWDATGAIVSPYEKFKILSVTGGIPRYLEEINPNRSAEENIRNLGFRKGGIFTVEFDHIFNDLFSKRSHFYKEIVRTLADGVLEYGQIAEILAKKVTGRLSSYLEDLKQAGFISRDFTWHFKGGKISKLSHYRLSDNYVRFYLKYIEPIKEKIEQEHLDTTFEPANWHAIQGLQFENLVLNNRQFVCKKLSINPQDIISNNPYFQRESSRHGGCQIDYLIQTKFNGLFACEIKFSKNLLGMEVVDEMRQKLSNLTLPRNFSCWPVLIHVNGVTDAVEQSGFFSKIIDFREIF